MLYNSKQWISDLDKIMPILPELNSIAGGSILITGANGLICSTVIDILFRYNDNHSTPIHIYAAGRKLEKMKARFGNMVEREDFTYVPYDASRLDNVFEFHADYIIHGASNAYPSAIIKEPVETIISNVMGLKALLDYAKNNGTKRILYISSSEVYGKTENDRPCREDEYGYIDLLNPRNSYAVGKRASETLCASYADEYGVETVIIRPGHIYGPTASPTDNRVSSAWAYSVASGGDIVMKSDGASKRSYCYCVDCASAILKALLKGHNVHAYNVSTHNSIITIKELADILTRSAGVALRIEAATDEEKKSFNPMSNSSLEASNLSMIGWKGCFTAEEGLSHTVTILREERSC